MYNKIMSDNKFVLLTSKECPHCNEAKELLKEKINNGMIKVLDYESPQGSELVSKYGIDEVPTIIYNNKKCQLAADGSKLFCGKEEVKI